ncbi:PREDICTED: alpha-tocopherol transfer protein-like [Nicrophorus vespilloides]|uniref:Alpha-tocopherol transfer protein-like n=1 Tax=Nicrophorus vespilloides TaxID=110193 RepID=A0ABM1N3D6_NICVS|nr:PREDICTED: alpha-tocopherol transfer protein-like [Nicrophorus vespilloides]
MSDCEVFYKNNNDLKREDVQTLEDWLKHQTQIPPITDRLLILFLHSCYYHIEATKKCIEEFFKARPLYPEFFKNRDPRQFETKLMNFCIAPLSKLTPEGYGIIYISLINTDPQTYDFDLHVKTLDMICLRWLQEVGCLKGHVLVFDLEGGSLSHLMRVKLRSVKSLIHYVQDSFPIRLKAIHFCNPILMMSAIMKLIKPFINSGVMSVLQVHSGNAVLDHIPADCLPDSVGGTLLRSKIHAEAVDTLIKNAEYFVEEEKKFTIETN